MDDAAPKPAPVGEAGRRVLAYALVAGCLLCVLLTIALISANLGALLSSSSGSALRLRQWLLTPGLFLLTMLLLAILVLAWTLRPTDRRRLRRLVERLYFVMAMTALVLLPSAVLGWIWASRLRPMPEAIATSLVEAVAQLLVLLLMWRNAFDAARLRA